MAILFSHHGELSILVYAIHMVQKTLCFFQKPVCVISHVSFYHTLDDIQRKFPIVILKHCHESEEPCKGRENMPRERKTRTSAMSVRFKLGTALMMPDGLSWHNFYTKLHGGQLAWFGSWNGQTHTHTAWWSYKANLLEIPLETKVGWKRMLLCSWQSDYLVALPWACMGCGWGIGPCICNIVIRCRWVISIMSHTTLCPGKELSVAST
jgi:hypothetical protein